MKGEPKRSVHDRLGTSAQPKNTSLHQCLGPKKPSVFQRLGQRPQVKRQKELVDIVPKLTIHARLLENPSSTSPRKVEIIVVDKRPNYYATQSGQRFQKLP
jgi:hypothetical protein